MRYKFFFSRVACYFALLTIWASCTEEKSIFDPPSKAPTPAITIETEAGTHQGPPIHIEIAEGAAYVIVGMHSFEGEWAALFQIKEHHLLDGSFTVELGSTRTDAFGRAGHLANEPPLEALGKGTALVTLGPGTATIEFEGDREEIRGRVEGRTRIDCAVPDPYASNEGILRWDDAFETAFCAQFSHLLPEVETASE